MVCYIYYKNINYCLIIKKHIITLFLRIFLKILFNMRRFSISLNKNTINLNVSKTILFKRNKSVKKPLINISDYLKKYMNLLGDLKNGYSTI